MKINKIPAKKGLITPGNAGDNLRNFYFYDKELSDKITETGKQLIKNALSCTYVKLFA